MFGKSTNQNHFPGFRVVTLLDGINGLLIQTYPSGVCDSKGCLKFGHRYSRYIDNGYFLHLPCSVKYQ